MLKEERDHERRIILNKREEYIGISWDLSIYVDDQRGKAEGPRRAGL